MTFRQLIIYLLLILLPVQVMASLVKHSCASEMPHCLKMETTSCCKHSVPSPDNRHVSLDKYDHTSQNKSDDPQSSACGMSTSCVVIAPVVALPNTPFVLPHVNAHVPNGFVSSFYISFLLDTPQRPPNFPA